MRKDMLLISFWTTKFCSSLLKFCRKMTTLYYWALHFHRLKMRNTPHKGLVDDNKTSPVQHVWTYAASTVCKIIAQLWITERQYLHVHMASLLSFHIPCYRLCPTRYSTFWWALSHKKVVNLDSLKSVDYFSFIHFILHTQIVELLNMLVAYVDVTLLLIYFKL